MSKLTLREKKAVVKNIKLYRKRLYPERGGGNRMAKELNVSPQLLSQWTSGVRTPPLEKLIALSAIFHISIQELCGQRTVHIYDNKISVHDAVIILSNHIKENKRGKKVKTAMETIKSFIDNELQDIAKKGNG